MEQSYLLVPLVKGPSVTLPEPCMSMWICGAQPNVCPRCVLFCSKMGPLGLVRITEAGAILMAGERSLGFWWGAESCTASCVPGGFVEKRRSSRDAVLTHLGEFGGRWILSHSFILNWSLAKVWASQWMRICTQPCGKTKVRCGKLCALLKMMLNPSWRCQTMLWD